MEKLEKKSFDFFTLNHNRTNLTTFQRQYEIMSKKLDDLKKAINFNFSDIKIKNINSELQKLK